ncbi:MAG: hypothetical protein KTR14_03160, partial [Vampirovibrio sp.]|nr:hypothetical protein [Vampirovibrio sp.]
LALEYVGEEDFTDLGVEERRRVLGTLGLAFMKQDLLSPHKMLDFHSGNLRIHGSSIDPGKLQGIEIDMGRQLDLNKGVHDALLELMLTIYTKPYVLGTNGLVSSLLTEPDVLRALTLLLATQPSWEKHPLLGKLQEMQQLQQEQYIPTQPLTGVEKEMYVVTDDYLEKFFNIVIARLGEKTKIADLYQWMNRLKGLFRLGRRLRDPVLRHQIQQVVDLAGPQSTLADIKKNKVIQEKIKSYLNTAEGQSFVGLMVKIAGEPEKVVKHIHVGAPSTYDGLASKWGVRCKSWFPCNWGKSLPAVGIQMKGKGRHRFEVLKAQVLPQVEMLLGSLFQLKQPSRRASKSFGLSDYSSEIKVLNPAQTNGLIYQPTLFNIWVNYIDAAGNADLSHMKLPALSHDEISSNDMEKARSEMINLMMPYFSSPVGDDEDREILLELSKMDIDAFIKAFQFTSSYGGEESELVDALCQGFGESTDVFQLVKQYMTLTNRSQKQAVTKAFERSLEQVLQLSLPVRQELISVYRVQRRCQAVAVELAEMLADYTRIPLSFDGFTALRKNVERALRYDFKLTPSALARTIEERLSAS